MPVITRPWGAYHHLDAGAGRPVVLLHAFPVSSALFAGQLRELPARLIVPDHRGFGASGDVPPDPVTMEDHADDVLALLDGLGLDRVVIGGVSMGGYITMALLRKAPRRVAGLILMDTQHTADPEETREGREKLARSVLADGLAALDPMIDKLVAPGSPHLDEVTALVRTGARPAGVAASARGMGLRPDSTDVLSACGGPALVLVGEQDGITGPPKAQAMARLLRHGTLEVIPGAGHLAALEAPEAVNRAIRAWLETVPE